MATKRRTHRHSSWGTRLSQPLSQRPPLGFCK